MKAILYKGEPAFLHSGFILFFIPTMVIVLAHLGEPNLVPLANPWLKLLCSGCLVASVLCFIVTFFVEAQLRPHVLIRSR